MNTKYTMGRRASWIKTERLNEDSAKKIGSPSNENMYETVSILCGRKSENSIGKELVIIGVRGDDDGDLRRYRLLLVHVDVWRAILSLSRRLLRRYTDDDGGGC